MNHIIRMMACGRRAQFHQFLLLSLHNLKSSSSLGITANTWNFSARESETGGSPVQSQHGLHSKTLLPTNEQPFTSVIRKWSGNFWFPWMALYVNHRWQQNQYFARGKETKQNNKTKQKKALSWESNFPCCVWARNTQSIPSYRHCPWCTEEATVPMPCGHQWPFVVL